MTIEQMRDAYTAQPFRPFTIHLADGREIPVDHPEFIMAAPSGRTIVVYQVTAYCALRRVGRDAFAT